MTATRLLTVDATAMHRALSPEELVRTHQADVWRYLRYLGCQASEADDLTQETFIAVLRAGPEQRSDGETAAYLRRAARNQMLMLRRRQGREPAMIEIAAAEQVWADAMVDGSFEGYLAALGECLETAVTPRVREVVAMHYSDGASRERIAAALKMTADGVKTLLRRARSALRECIERKQRREQ